MNEGEYEKPNMIYGGVTIDWNSLIFSWKGPELLRYIECLLIYIDLIKEKVFIVYNEKNITN